MSDFRNYGAPAVRWSRVGLLLFALQLMACGYVSHEPVNFQKFREQLVEYHDSGAYAADLEHALQPAYRYLEKQADPTKKQAVVFDVDDTSLSNWPNLARTQFCYNAAASKQWIESGASDALAPTLALYRHARELGYGIFFITGRAEDKRTTTTANLKRVGFTEFEELILSRPGLKLSTAAEYKAPERKRIEEEGWDIVLSVGDQQSDLAGGYADRTIKLPNPFYYIK